MDTTATPATHPAPAPTPPPATLQQVVVDTVMAVTLTVLFWMQMFVPRQLFHVRLPPRENVAILVGPQTLPVLPAALLVAACFLPLALRRRYPIGVLVAVSIAVSLHGLFPGPVPWTQLAVLIAAYTAASRVDRRTLMPWAAGCAALVVITSVPPVASLMFWPDLVRTAALLLGAMAIGDATRAQRAYVAQVEQRAIEAERMRDEETRRRVDEERLNIARELHDITAHSLSIVAVQSGAALHVLDSDPAAARTALEAIRETSKSALTELRGVLGVLRGAGTEGGPLPLRPAPGLARLDDIVRPLVEAGMTVDVEIDTGAEPLPAIVDAGAFRIVQEALTNVLRHSNGSHARVRVWRDEATLALEVTDDGAGGLAASPEGHGIAGMRERALALGGTLGAGPAPGGGWHVFARLPLAGMGA